MKSNSFIATQIYTQTEEKYTNNHSPLNTNWVNRARKLQERRWRKLANRTNFEDSYARFKFRQPLAF